MDVLIRSIGLEPSKLTLRVKFHFLARLFGFVEANYNFIELGPRGTGKSYVFSEFSPYSTLVSGGQASTSVLLYNNAKRQVGLVGFWDMMAFDEVGGVKIKDSEHHRHSERLHGQRAVLAGRRGDCQRQPWLYREHRPFHRSIGQFHAVRPVHSAPGCLSTWR